MYTKTIVSTLFAWIVGLFIDANIGMQPIAVTELRVVLPVLAAALCVLSEIKKINSKSDK